MFVETAKSTGGISMAFYRGSMLMSDGSSSIATEIKLLYALEMAESLKCISMEVMLFQY